MIGEWLNDGVHRWRHRESLSWTDSTRRPSHCLHDSISGKKRVKEVESCGKVQALYFGWQCRRSRVPATSIPSSPFDLAANPQRKRRPSLPPSQHHLYLARIACATHRPAVDCLPSYSCCPCQITPARHLRRKPASIPTLYPPVAFLSLGPPRHPLWR